MNQEFEKISQCLLELVSATRSTLTELANNRTIEMTDIKLEDLAELPEIIQEKLTEVTAIFEQISKDNEDLAEELLLYYDQLNAAFSAVTAVAKCKTTHEAVNVLIREIGTAIQGRFRYYLGPLGRQVGPINEKNDTPANLIYMAEPNVEPDSALQFFIQYETELRKLAESQADCQTKMIGYKDKILPDYQGRGNVLMLHLEKNNCGPLTSPHSKELSGSVLFVRAEKQVPFQAVDMNIASTLVKMGVAVIGNIIYAQELSETYVQTVASLVRAMETKDAYTCGHSNRVAQIAVDLGRYIGLPEHELQMLEWTGLLHDVGKIGIKDNILCKPGKLTNEEFDHIKLHPVKSYNVLEPIAGLQKIMPAVRHHHEHYDGSGYPDGLAGENIPLHARILQVADVWDALTSTRSYRKAMSKEKAMDIMTEEAGMVMDLKLIKEFQSMVKENPTLLESYSEEISPATNS